MRDDEALFRSGKVLGVHLSPPRDAGAQSAVSGQAYVAVAEDRSRSLHARCGGRNARRNRRRENALMSVPRVVPMLSYEDVGAAADWLCSAFGFTETARFSDSGRVTHVELSMGDAVVMAGWPGRHYESPGHHR